MAVCEDFPGISRRVLLVDNSTPDWRNSPHRGEVDRGDRADRAASEPEVAYSNTHAATYSLWVVYAVDHDAGTGRLIRRKGRITDDDVDLRAAIHGGRLKNVKSSKKLRSPT